MKFFFSLIFLILLSQPLLSKNFETKYKIKTKGITIGSLKWLLEIKDNTYITTINLKNTEFLSKLYSFNGKYTAVGNIKNNFFYSKKYNQFWKTKKKEKVVKLTFNKTKVEKMFLYPKEQEFPRVKYKKLKNYNDPITAFLNIIFNQSASYVIDGRRIYLLKPNKKEKITKILIEKYINIWADHKRNDLEYIEIFLEENINLPKKINFMFKGSVFSLYRI